MGNSGQNNLLPVGSTFFVIVCHRSECVCAHAAGGRETRKSDIKKKTCVAVDNNYLVLLVFTTTIILFIDIIYSIPFP